MPPTSRFRSVDTMGRSTTRRNFLAAGASLIATGSAYAAFPDRPIRIVVPFATSGPPDISMRILSNYLGAKMDCAVIVDNRPGAGGNIGTSFVARAAADGYTLCGNSSAIVINPSLYKHVPYDLLTDFEPVVKIGTSPNMFVANPKTKITTIDEMIARFKSDASNGLPCANAGVGTTPHLSVELLNLRAGIKMTSVPFNGAGPAVQSVIGGNTPVGCVALPGARPFIADGLLKPLAVTGEHRWFDLPDVPTMLELGYQDFVTDTFVGLLAPAKTPSDIIQRLAQASIDTLHDKTVQDQLRTAGFETLAYGPVEFRHDIERELVKWRDVITKAGIQKI